MYPLVHNLFTSNRSQFVRILNKLFTKKFFEKLLTNYLKYDIINIENKKGS